MVGRLSHDWQRPLSDKGKVNGQACFTIGVLDVDAVCSELAERGIKPVNGPVDRPWGPRAAYFADPGGYVYEFAAHKQD